MEVGYVGTRGIHLRETRDAIQSVDAMKHPFTVTDSAGNTLHNHDRHVCQCDRAHADAGFERL